MFLAIPLLVLHHRLVETDSHNGGHCSSQGNPDPEGRRAQLDVVQVPARER